MASKQWLAVFLGVMVLAGPPVLLGTNGVEAASAKRTVAPSKVAAARTAAKPAVKNRSAKASSRKASVRKTSRASTRSSNRTASKVSVGKASVAASAPSRQVLAARAASANVHLGNRSAKLVRTGRAASAAASSGSTDYGSVVSIGEAIGLHLIPDPLALRSGVALVLDPNTGEILYEKNSRAVLPIASITKLMTAMVVLDAGQSLDEKLTIESVDRDTERFSTSHLPVGTTLTRGEMLQLALMSSENRAASALSRNYPGGLDAFLAAANRKAARIGMRDSMFHDGTGLSSSNVSTARDLAVMVAAAGRYPQIREFSTSTELSVRLPHGGRVFRTTNRMVVSPDWNLSLQKTGFINEAGNCLVIQGDVDGRQLIMVLLDSQGRYSRIGDATRIRRWLEG